MNSFYLKRGTEFTALISQIAWIWTNCIKLKAFLLQSACIRLILKNKVLL